MKVKILRESDYVWDLQDKINDFLEKIEEKQFVDIKILKVPGLESTLAMIIYKD